MRSRAFRTSALPLLDQRKRRPNEWFGRRCSFLKRERATGLEPATSSLGSREVTTPDRYTRYGTRLRYADSDIGGLKE